MKDTVNQIRKECYESHENHKQELADSIVLRDALQLQILLKEHFSEKS